MNSTLEKATDPLDVENYTNTTLIVIGLVMQIGHWILKIKKRLTDNESRVEEMERKLSRLRRV